MIIIRALVSLTLFAGVVLWSVTSELAVPSSVLFTGVSAFGLRGLIASYAFFVSIIALAIVTYVL